MGIKQHKDTPPMEREINYLLYDLCVIWGFCIPPRDAEEISLSDTIDASEFAKNVLAAEGMNISSERQWFRRISTKFSERFGADSISKSTFTDRVRGTKEIW